MAPTVQIMILRGTAGSSGGTAKVSSVCFLQRGHCVIVPTSSA
jgi:hypothetical protein